MNAITSPDRQARRARHLRQCEHLAEMAMELAEAAHAQALRDARPPPDRPRPSLTMVPAYMPPPTGAAYDRTLASNFFQEFSRCVRQAILLEARLDSGAYENAPALPNVSEHVARQRETSENTPTGPRQPSDETRIHHERLEDECLIAHTGDPDEILRIIADNLDSAIAQAPRAGLDLSHPRANVTPPPRTSDTGTPEPARPATNRCPAAPATANKPAPRASPARSARR